MITKAAMALISKAIFYYSPSGNTKALIELSDTSGFEIFNMARMAYADINFEAYALILLGTSTTGRGVPHNFFLKIQSKLFELKGKKIGLFGSGNSSYEEYCGALDVIEPLLCEKNEILFKFRFESYPTGRVLKEFQDIINQLKGD
jgi:flavodoxin I